VGIVYESSKGHLVQAVSPRSYVLVVFFDRGLFQYSPYADKTCDGEQPCGRCVAAKRLCEEAVRKKMGRPKRAIEADVTDPRVVAAHDLILKHVRLVFEDPISCARAFGINLGNEFYVCQVPNLDMGKTLQEFENNMRIHYVSEAMCKFLGKPAEDIQLESSIKWLNTVCLPPDTKNNCMRLALTSYIPQNFVRIWTHLKSYRAPDGVWECDVRGFILSNLVVMFVEVAGRRFMANAPNNFPPSKLIWDDCELEGIELDDDSMFGATSSWIDECGSL
jgi:hypothetical protein